MIEIISKQGLASNASKPNQTYNGLLGISIPKMTFTNEFVAEVALLGSQVCKEFIIVLVDFPERFNWLLHGGSSRSDAVESLLKLSADRKSGYYRALRKIDLHERVKIFSWLHFIDNEAYKRNVRVIKRCFFSDAAFHHSVTSQVTKSIGGRIQATEEVIGRKLLEDEIEEISHYLLEELAGLFHIYFDLGYRIDFYPGVNPQLFEDIYANKFPSLSKELGYDWPQRGWVELQYTKGS